MAELARDDQRRATVMRRLIHCRALLQQQPRARLVAVPARDVQRRGATLIRLVHPLPARLPAMTMNDARPSTASSKRSSPARVASS